MERIRALLVNLPSEKPALKQLRKLKIITRHLSNTTAQEFALRDPSLANECVNALVAAHYAAPKRLKLQFLLPIRDCLFIFRQFCRISTAFKSLLSQSLVDSVEALLNDDRNTPPNTVAEKDPFAVSANHLFVKPEIIPNDSTDGSSILCRRTRYFQNSVSKSPSTIVDPRYQMLADPRYQMLAEFGAKYSIDELLRTLLGDLPYTSKLASSSPQVPTRKYTRR